MFIDLVKINVKSGNGGDGAIAWRREKFVEKGGPAGGDGGHGGDIVLKATNDLSTLLEFKYKSSFEAENGQKGQSKKCHGKKGKDLVILVPTGTIVRDCQTGKVIADLQEDEQTAMVASGGKGGKGNANFATSTRQTPQFCEPGEAGIERELELELKLLADVGIIGLPNAGKSTFISVVSAAKPKIADYPFTTLIPNLGVVKTPEGAGIVFADIPGLIEGACKGVGLGHQFLRHVERTRLLIHMIDALEIDPIKNYKSINEELSCYSDYLASIEQVVAINKIDSIDEEVLEYLKTQLSEYTDKVFAISAVTTQGCQELVNYVCERLQEIPKVTQLYDIVEDEAATDHDDSDFAVCQEGDIFYIEGGKISRLIRVANLEDSQALFRLQNILKGMGVFEALKTAGAEDGNTVIIDQFAFEYYEDQ